MQEHSIDILGKQWAKQPRVTDGLRRNDRIGKKKLSKWGSP